MLIRKFDESPAAVSRAGLSVKVAVIEDSLPGLGTARAANGASPSRVAVRDILLL